MSQYSEHSTDLLMQWEPAQPIPLESEQFQQAVDLSDRLPTEDTQWKTYLNLLMLAGFQSWLMQRSPDLVINTQNCSIFEPAIANVLDAVCNLEIAGFRICLIRLEETVDEKILIPRAVLDLPDFIAHFYVVIDVLEEEQEISIHSILSHQQFSSLQQAHCLEPQVDWTYAIPIRWFSQSLTHFIVALRCKDFCQFVLPEIPSRPDLLPHQWTELYKEFIPVISRLSQSQDSLQSTLTWSQGLNLFTHFDMARWFYQEQVQSHKPAQNQQNSFPQSCINTWIMLQDQFDQTLEQMGWVMRPSIMVADTFRHNEQHAYQDLLQELNQQGITLPRKQYTYSLPLGDEKLYLSAIPVSASKNCQETFSQWRLLIVLDAQLINTLPMDTTQSLHKLPVGTTLQIDDQESTLIQLVADSETSYLYCSVLGECHEQFIVTVKLANGISQTMKPFAYRSTPTQ